MSLVENTMEQLLSAGSWAVDPAYSTLEFRVKHLMIQTVRGRFRDFEAMIVAGDEPSVNGKIKVASLETLNEERDAHLRSADFFDADRYPLMTFRASGLEFSGDGRQFTLPGELTIKGVTRPIRLNGQLHGGVTDDDRARVALTMRGHLDRTDYGLVWNRVLETGGLLVGDIVELTLDVAAVRVD
jgi:polyisoprenoid-binding protein YceI